MGLAAFGEEGYSRTAQYLGPFNGQQNQPSQALLLQTTDEMFRPQLSWSSSGSSAQLLVCRPIFSKTHHANRSDHPDCWCRFMCRKYEYAHVPCREIHIWLGDWDLDLCHTNVGAPGSRHEII